jgi:UDP-N-acetylglucosamine transferase subunit ALG13
MIFLTVGTEFSFDRLVKAVDDAVENGLVDEQIYAQIGQSSYKPRNFEYIEPLEKKAFDNQAEKASSIISHAGTGIITLTLAQNKPLLVIPRLRKYGEVVHDHQVWIARKFEQLGHILVVYDVKDLPDGIRRLKNFVPRKRQANPRVVADRIGRFLDILK